MGKIFSSDEQELEDGEHGGLRVQGGGATFCQSVDNNTTTTKLKGEQEGELPAPTGRRRAGGKRRGAQRRRGTRVSVGEHCCCEADCVGLVAKYSECL